MSQSTSPAVTDGLAQRGAPVLTPAGIEAILADFRAWLTDLAASGAEPAPPPHEPFELHALAGQFTALRHEVNLQTKAARAQQEQAAEALRQLTEAVDACQAAQAEEEPAEDGPALRSLLAGLVDSADALALAQHEVERLAQASRAAVAELQIAAPPAEDVRSLWTRWFKKGTQLFSPGSTGEKSPAAETNRMPSPAAAEACQRLLRLLDSVLTGYRMSLQRLKRTLQQHGLEEMPCLGQPFDPERMEALEAVADSGRPDGEVLAVARPGYQRHGKVFRCALVRVAAPQSRALAP